jgi:hypothetical protein
MTPHFHAVSDHAACIVLWKTLTFGRPNEAKRSVAPWCHRMRLVPCRPKHHALFSPNLIFSPHSFSLHPKVLPLILHMRALPGHTGHCRHHTVAPPTPTRRWQGGPAPPPARLSLLLLRRDLILKLQGAQRLHHDVVRWGDSGHRHYFRHGRVMGSICWSPSLLSQTFLCGNSSSFLLDWLLKFLEWLNESALQILLAHEFC